MKHQWRIASMTFISFVGMAAGAVKAQPISSNRDLGGQARELFAAKCAICHGPDLAKPRGRFGYVLDLRRVAANPEMVIPSQPDQSELWVLVQQDEMPPPDSPAGSLSADQKEIVRKWIAAGAPDAVPATSVSLSTMPGDVSVSGIAETATVGRLIRWLGRFHLLLIHFPIALVVAAGVGEVRSAWVREVRPSEAVRFCLRLGALAAIPAAGLGWLFAAAGNGVASPQLLMAHRWLGPSAALWLVMTAICAERDSRRG